MAKRTKIAGAEFIVAFDGVKHRLIPNGDIIYQGDTIIYVGQDYSEPVDEIIDASDYVVIPGLISLHAHLMYESKCKGFIEEVTSRKLWKTSLYEYIMPLEEAAFPEDAMWVLRYGLTDILKGGCTTVADMSHPTDEAIEVYGESGIRAYVAYMYRDASWNTPNGHELCYKWDLEKGRAGLHRAVELIEKHSGRFDDRFRGYLCPLTVDNCTPELLRETKVIQKQLKVPVQIHASQAVAEFWEMMRRHGMTPIEWLGSLGFLDSDTILGHAVYLNHHTSIRYRDHDDLALIAETGATVAHCPWVFGRRGQHLESFGRYLQRGVNLGIGTDTIPLDILESMRWACAFGKNVEDDPACPTAAQVFDAATLGGAKALGRKDLGRITPGAKADMVLINANTIPMRPMRDPIKNILYAATSRSIDKVIVNGRVVVNNGRVLFLDEDELTREMQRIAKRTWDNIPNHDSQRRTVDELSPLSYQLWDGKVRNKTAE
ncbi:MAG: amidohydrolase family protein [Bacillota bacterium]|jgi:5-methylthioadenosine/S-adenosylhomocysteine deaminase